jgi:hypothetical protein
VGERIQEYGDERVFPNAYEIDEQTFHNANPSHGKVSPDPLW